MQAELRPLEILVMLRLPDGTVNSLRARSVEDSLYCILCVVAADIYEHYVVCCVLCCIVFCVVTSCG